MSRKWIARVMLAGSCFVMLSCPNPLDEAILLHVKDEIGPVITISSPTEGSYCAQTVIVSGTVSDSATTGGEVGEVKALSYEVLSTFIAGAISVGSDGAFSFQFSTTSLGPNFVLRVAAEDWNGNKAERSLTLLKRSGNDIPSFTAVPDSQKVTLTWDDIPLATSYTLYYTTNGNLPSGNYGTKVEGVTSPKTLEGLANGSMHVFVLQAHSSEGEDNWSGYVRAIPLSPQTLAPRITGEFKQIQIEWPEIPADVDFEVWRSTEKDGTYLNISGTIRNTWLVDTEVEDGQNYYYKIRPSMQGSLDSWPNCGQASPFYMPYPLRLGSYISYGAGMSVLVQGDYAYVPYDYLFLILDISNPALPILVSTYDTPVSATDVAVSGNYAYIADNSGGLVVLNITNKASPTLAGSFNTTGPAYSVEVKGNYAYVADYTAGLLVLDVTNPGTIFPVGSVNTPGEAYGVTLNGDYAYVADGLSGLEIFDISASQPVLTGVYNTPGVAYNVAVSGNYAYIADGASGGLRIVNITNKYLPIPASFYDTSGVAQDVAVSGSYAFVADQGSGLHVINVSNPSAPMLIGTYDTYLAHGVAVNGDYAYVADFKGLYTFNVMNPLFMTSAGSLDTPASAYGVTVSGNYAYIADHESGLQIIDISVPTAPIPAGSVDTPGSAHGVTVSGNYAYIADHESGLQIIDISVPTAPIPAGSFNNTPGSAYGVALCGNYALVADGIYGIQIINVAIPSSPCLAGFFDTDSSSMGVVVKGNYAYVADGAAGLLILDITNPSSPIPAGPSLALTDAKGVAVSGNYAYVADGSSGLRIIDISDPSAPTLKGTYDTLDAQGVTVSSGYAFVADGTQGMRILNISNPVSPIQVGSYPTLTAARGVATCGAYAYVAADSSGLHVVKLLQ